MGLVPQSGHYGLFFWRKALKGKMVYVEPFGHSPHRRAAWEPRCRKVIAFLQAYATAKDIPHPKEPSITPVILDARHRQPATNGVDCGLVCLSEMRRLLKGEETGNLMFGAEVPEGSSVRQARVDAAARLCALAPAAHS